MSIQAVLLPLFVEVVLTFVLLYWMAYQRTKARRRQARSGWATSLREPNWPVRATQVANAFHNQLELPILFYVLTILALITRHADLVLVVLADLRRVAPGAGLHPRDRKRRPSARPGVRRGRVVLTIMWAIFMIRILPASDDAGRPPLRRHRGHADIEARGGRPRTRSRTGVSHIASPAPATAPPSRAPSTTRCAGGQSSAHVMGDGAPRALLLGMLRLERVLDPGAIATLADGAPAPAPLTAEERARLETPISPVGRPGSPATIRNGSIPISPACSARSAPPRARRLRAARRSICASTAGSSSARAAAALVGADPVPTRWSPVGLWSRSPPRHGAGDPPPARLHQGHGRVQDEACSSPRCLPPPSRASR